LQGVHMMLSTRDENGNWVLSDWDNDRGIPNRLTSEQIVQLRHHTFQPGSSDNEENSSCGICQSAFEFEEILIELPACKHSFHQGCISSWFAMSDTCPL